MVFNLPSAGYGWTSDTAYALGDAELDDIRVGNQYLAMGRATSVRELLAVEQRYLGNPAFNTIAADDRGDALYADIGATPNVSQALIDDCIPQGAPQLVFTSARLITLDGSRTACAVPTARGTPVAGLLPPSQLPYLLRRDYVENSNDSYWLANPARPLVGFSPIVGLEGTLLGFRTRSGNTMIRERLARARFTIPALRALWQNDRNYAAELLAGQLAAACAASPAVAMPDGSTVDVGAACPVLERYGRTGNLDDAGAWLFGEWLRRAPSVAALFKDGLDPAAPHRHPDRAQHRQPGGPPGPRGRGLQPDRARRRAGRDPASGPARDARVPGDSHPRLLRVLPGHHRLRRRSARRRRSPVRRALRRGHQRLVDGADHGADQARPAVAGHSHLLAGHRSDVAVVREPDPAVLGQALGADAVPAVAAARGSGGAAGSAAASLIRSSGGTG